MIKTFRGIVVDGGQERIHLSTIKGMIGYKIVKFDTIQLQPGVTAGIEGVTKIYTKEQSSITGTIDFADSDLLGVAVRIAQDSPTYPMSESVIFDNVIINQDMYVTFVDNGPTNSINYYIELEVITLTEQAAEYITLKDIRSATSTI